MRPQLESQRSQVDNRRFKWTSKTLWGYGVGHVQSDLVATMWFAYLLVFLEQVVGLAKVNAGVLLTIGQLTDGIATPLVGIGLDKLGLCGSHYGPRKSWHMLGTLLITISFPFIYSPPPGYERWQTEGKQMANWSDMEMMFYYSPFIVIFQIAWASAQVSHLSLIPCLTCKDSARIQLTSLRNAFTLLSSIAIYVTAYGLFMTSRDNSEALQLNSTVTNLTDSNCTNSAEPVDQVSWQDRDVYQTLAIGAVALGIVVQGAIFHFFVHEPNNCADQCDLDTKYFAASNGDETDEIPREGFKRDSVKNGTLECQALANSTLLTSKTSLQVLNQFDTTSEKDLSIEISSWQGWFKCPLFYLVAVQYCLTRMVVNITASYMPFFLQESLDLPKEYIAIVPLVQFIVGFLVSFAMKPLSKHIGKNGSYFLGCILCIAGSICATILEGDQKYRLFLLPVFFGAGCATILVQSLAMTAALIGENTTTAAFVYGAMSLTDKIACGGAIMLVQAMSPCREDMVPNGPCEENGCGLYYCRLLGYGIAAITVCAIISNVIHWYKTKDTRLRSEDKLES